MTATAPSSPPAVAGLEDVVACTSGVCFIDGLADPSVLEYRGYPIGVLVGSVSFEETAHLMLLGQLPDAGQLAAFQEKLRAARALPAGVLDVIRALPAGALPAAALRTVVSLLGCQDEIAHPGASEPVREKAIRLTAVLPTVVAALYRVGRGLEPVAPDPALSHAANYLAMLNGTAPSVEEASALDAALTLYAEHELNASTFAVRVTAGTQSDYYSAIVAGLCALKGPLHGGAADDAMQVLEAIGTVENVAPWIDRAFAEKRLIAGFGHRVYKTGDARTPHLREMCLALSAARSGDAGLIDVALAAERHVRSRKKLVANVDFYAAALLYYLGFPRNVFTNFVTSSRIVGWSAHALEQYENNRLIRPRAYYTGEHGRPLVALAER